MRVSIVLLLFIVSTNAIPTKRQAQNSYGDESETPGPSIYSGTTTAASVEYAPSHVAQTPATQSPAVESSGYRHKRQSQNSYGDESQTPAPTNSAVSAAPATEYAPAEVSQEAVTQAPAVESSGYRHKRQSQNSYGDELQTPSPSYGVAQSMAVASEYAPAQVSQEVVTETPAVESSGYRHKRGATETPAVELSGYRHKRGAQNAYGDEAQTPAPSSNSETTPIAAAEIAPSQVVQPAATQAPAVQSSGYRQ